MPPIGSMWTSEARIDSASLNMRVTSRTIGASLASATSTPMLFATVSSAFAP